MLRKSTIRHKIRELRERAKPGSFRGSRGDRFARKYADKTSRLIRTGVDAMGNEAGETEQMARSFFRMLEAKLDLSGRTEPPTEAEVRAAIEQLKDVGRFSVFATLVILPGGIFSLVGLELLARKFGIRGFSMVPSSFRRNREQMAQGKGDEQKNTDEPGPDG